MSDLNAKAEGGKEPRLVDNRDDLTVGLKFGDEEYSEGALVELTLSSVVVDFRFGSGPFLPLNEQVSMTFASSCWGNLVLAKAKVAFRSDQRDNRRYRLTFEGDDELRARLTRKLMKLLSSRRLAYRAVPDTPIVVTARARSANDKDPFGTSNPFATSNPELLGTLHDVSSVGAAIVLPPNADNELSMVDLIDIELSVPGQPKVLKFTGWIRGRWLEASGEIRYGIEYDANLTSDFEAKQNQLSDFVLSHQADAVEEAPIGPPKDVQFLNSLSPLEQAIYAQSAGGADTVHA